MILTVEQHLRIASVYDKAAADKMGIPPQQRVAFARKAKWIRMLARIKAKKDAAIATAVSKECRLQEVRPEAASEKQAPSNGAQTPKARYETLAQRLERARAAAEAKQPQINGPRSSGTGAAGRDTQNSLRST
jgi:hypothetical protein